MVNTPLKPAKPIIDWGGLMLLLLVFLGLFVLIGLVLGLITWLLQ